MGKVQLGGVEIDTLNQSELREALLEAQANQYEKIKGRKLIKYRSPSAAPSGGALTLGGAQHGQGTILGPTQGYRWHLRLLVVSGLTASASSPDVVNIYKDGTGDLMWQLNGNVFAQTWGYGEMPLNGGEALYIQNSGTLAATGNIYFHGWAEEVITERDSLH